MNVSRNSISSDSFHISYYFNSSTPTANHNEVPNIRASRCDGYQDRCSWNHNFQLTIRITWRYKSWWPRDTSSVFKLALSQFFSPVILTPKVLEKVNSLGTLWYIVGLNQEYHLHLSSWAKEFPQTKVIGMEGLPEKREKKEARQGVRFDTVFTNEGKLDIKIAPEFDNEFQYEYIPSLQNRELVFIHIPTRTLMEADVIFNLPATEQYSRSGENPSSGILGLALGKLMNANGHIRWQGRMMWYVSGSKDRQGLAESLRRIQNWGFRRIIPCHGDVIEEDAKIVFDQVAKRFLEGKH